MTAKRSDPMTPKANDCSVLWSPTSDLWSLTFDLRPLFSAPCSMPYASPNPQSAIRNPKSQAPNLKVSGFRCQVSGQRNTKAETWNYEVWLLASQSMLQALCLLATDHGPRTTDKTPFVFPLSCELSAMSFKCPLTSDLWLPTSDFRPLTSDLWPLSSACQPYSPGLFFLPSINP